MRKFLFLGIVLGLFFLNAPNTQATAVQQEGEERSLVAQRILAEMSAEERVGQLFLVTFQGSQATIDSDIANLILNYHVGGVVLEAENENITGLGNLENIPSQVATLTNDLQRLAIEGQGATLSTTPETIIDPEAVPPTRPASEPQTAVPLFVAVSQHGDGFPNSEIWNGVTAVPNNMAIGASWEPTQAQLVGSIVGSELSQMGFNMLFGPSLDILETPAILSENNIGTSTFGGDPYWVSVMAESYTTGVHLGSQQRMAVVPNHFPGYGSSDRRLHDEVPTVRKSLDQLTQFELVPFMAVARQDENDLNRADALLTTHIRYQGFQGNIRATTNPVSFDQQALSILLNQPVLATWRNNGGVLVSDSLGVRAVERFYDDTGESFPHRVIAKDAFSAGNDLLYLGDFALGENNYQQELLNIQDTVSWFQERYQTEASFQQLVDTAVLRILELKLRLYKDDFEIDNVLTDSNLLIETQDEALIELAQKSVTIISPTQAELSERLPRPPSSGDRIIIFTEVQTARQCASCPVQALIGVNDIAQRILALYGPNASGQIQPNQISSFSFADLDAFLAQEGEPIFYPPEPITSTIPLDATATAVVDPTNTPVPTPTPPPAFLIQEALRDTDWIIFGLTTNENSTPTLSNFLAQRPDLARNSEVVVFAYTVPYLLDTTEISQLAAYFAVYSKTEPFIDTSVRALFQELPLTGNSPVSIESIRYNIFEQTQPNANQQIDLFVVDAEGEPLPLSSEPLNVSVGDTLPLQTGVILDKNGNPVPDDTIVQFIQRDLVAGSVSILAEAPTENGIAEFDYLLEARTEAGRFQITAVSGEARLSLEVNISVDATDGEAQLSVSTPVPPPTATPEPTETPEPTSTFEPTPTASPTATATAVLPIEPEDPGVRITLPELQLLLTMLLGLASVTGVSLFLTPSVVKLNFLVGRLLWAWVGALVVYIYFVLGLPGTAVFNVVGNWAGLLTSLVGGGAGLLLYHWQNQQSESAS